ncbi:uncharacterized protein LOC142166366 [Nicotiana tabacum]|uniref:Uncharacterized protein LOC142166366 n=1 Tax=Nicotiana tabacum TaxID=4097 RepID=A0AC58S9B8_TOBAC
MRHEVPRFGMVTNIRPKLLSWWEDLHFSDQTLVRKYLGDLPSLLEIQPNNKIIEAATLFWDCERSVFRFGDIEMTPLLEEIGGLAGIAWETLGLLMPEKRKGRGFLKMMGLKKNLELTCLKESYIPFDYLYERYSHNKSYRTYPDEFAITSLGHIHRRVFVFMFYFLGLIVFPMKKARIHTRLAMVTKTLMEGIGGQPFSIVPMIIAEIYRALEKCQRGAKHFEGCNLLLQLWLIEHFQRGEYQQEIQRRDWDDHIDFHHPRRMNYMPNMFAQPEDAKVWVVLFDNLTEGQVQWMFEWFPTEEFISRSRDAPFLILIGLRGIYPYVPLRVMRQAGRKHVIPRVDKMSDFRVDDSPYKCQAQHMRHDKIVMGRDTIEPDRYHAGCAPYYSGWLEDNHDGLGQLGFARGTQDHR